MFHATENLLLVTEGRFFVYRAVFTQTLLNGNAVTFHMHVYKSLLFIFMGMVSTKAGGKYLLMEIVSSLSSGEILPIRILHNKTQ